MSDSVRAVGLGLTAAALVALALGALALASAQQPTPTQPAPAGPLTAGGTAARILGQTTTVIVVRHAEKDPAGDPRDPGLSEAGRARARALAQMLAQSGANRLYATEFRRARETLAPLAERLAVETSVVPSAEPTRLVEILKSLPGGAVAVVAGHSNTVPAIVRALGGVVRGTLDEAEYGRIFVVTRFAQDPGAPEVATLELAYPAGPE